MSSTEIAAVRRSHAKALARMTFEQPEDAWAAERKRLDAERDAALAQLGVRLSLPARILAWLSGR